MIQFSSAARKISLGFMSRSPLAKAVFIKWQLQKALNIGLMNEGSGYLQLERGSNGEGNLKKSLGR
jgi:hypothetical protein